MRRMRFLALGGAVLFALAPLAARAKDPPEIERIRAQYKEATAGGGKAFYVTEVEINTGQNNAPAVGTYHKKVRFFWDWPSGGNAILVRAELEAQISAPHYIEEYLFAIPQQDEPDARQGKLIFAYVRGGYEERDTRCYFKDDKLIRVVEGNTTRDQPAGHWPTLDREVQTRAKKVLDAFRALDVLPP